MAKAVAFCERVKTLRSNLLKIDKLGPVDYALALRDGFLAFSLNNELEQDLINS
jgi:hypothetical protein